ncbi:MAG: flippase activity-associated protein Agl23 [Solirubrobacteraceae bacterium]
MTEITTRPADRAPAPEAAAEPDRRRRSPRAWLTDRSKLEVGIWVGLIAIAFALRMYDLGSRPFHHDESQDAYFSWLFYKDFGSYHYQPLLHGPLRFYLTGLNYALFGDSNVTARLAPAVMGTIAVGLPYLLREQLGRIAAFTAGVLLAVGPSYLYFSRFAREDIYIAAITLGMIVAAFRFLRRPRDMTLSLLAALLALSFATKESTFITVAIAGPFFVGAIVVQGVRARGRGRPFADGEVLRAMTHVGWVGWAYAFATFWLVFALMFTVFFTQSDGLWNGIHDGLAYWQSQQKVNRGSEPWYFYFAVLFGEEWPALLLGAVGAVFAFLRPTTLRIFLVWFFVTSLAAYSVAGERFAWLVLHPLLPLLLLAGIGVQELWRMRSRVARVVAVVGIALCFVYVGIASFVVNAKHGANPREWLVSTQSSVEVKQIADRVDALGRRLAARGTPLTINIDSGQSATFPYAWYFRHQTVGYIDMTTPGYVPTTQVLIVTQEARDALRPNLSAYQGERFHFRVWWVRDWKKKLSPDAWWSWFTERKTWNPTGGLDEYLYVRKDAGPF